MRPALSQSPAKDLAGGKLHFILTGKKLSGEWDLVRLRDGKDWLLIRGQKNLRPVSKKMDDTSALSGKTMKQLAAGIEVWDSNSGSAKVSKATIVKKSLRRPLQ